MKPEQENNIGLNEKAYTISLEQAGQPKVVMTSLTNRFVLIDQQAQNYEEGRASQ